VLITALTLIAFLGWAFGDIFLTIASRKIGGYSSVFWTTFLGVILFAFLIPSHLPELSLYTPWLLLENIAVGSLLTIGMLTYATALERSNASVVSTIAGSFTAITIILSLIFFKESITLIQAGAIIVIFTGITLSTLKFGELRQKNIWQDKSLFLAILTMLAWGGFYAFMKPVTQAIGWFWPIYISFWYFLVILLYLKLKKIRLEKPTANAALFFIILSALFMRGAEVSFNTALSQGPTSFVAPIAGSYPALFVIVASFVFKDKLSTQQKWGIIITLLGIVFISSLR
jgi:transporter family protein